MLCMRIGIDFGTTHTSAAWYDGNNVHFVSLDEQNQDQHILRSMIYFNRSHEWQLGVDAVETFLAEDTGREVEYVEKVVGTIENTVAQTSASRAPNVPDGPITIVYDVLIDEDIGAQGRLLQSIKTGLQSAEYKGTDIFGRFYPLEELIGLILTRVRQQAEKQLGGPIKEAVLGRPVKFSDDNAVDRFAEQRLKQAAGLAGFEDVVFEKEPIAAALFYLNQAQHPQTILVFDFGGGTLDLTVVKAEGHDASATEILASQGVLIGGDDLDSALMRDSVAPHFGSRTRIDRNYDDQEMFLAPYLVQSLYRWQTIPLLSRPDALKIIERAIRYGGDPNAFRALKELATQNYGFLLFERIERAKRQLSEVRSATIDMHAGLIDLDIEVSRQQFNSSIGDEVADIRSSVRSVVQNAGISKDAIDVVVTTGGSSAIPIFLSMLRREFPDAALVQSDAFGSVTGGLAIRAAS